MEMKDLDHVTSLMIACRYGNIESIMCLLSHGADVTETDKDEKTCLMWAVEENRVEAVTVGLFLWLQPLCSTLYASVSRTIMQ